MKQYTLGLFLVLCSLTFSSSAFAQNLTDGDPSNDVCLSLQTSLFRYQSKDSTTNGEVSIIQDFLISKGMLGGTPTGFYGRLTVAGVKAYQRSVGVSPTGNVGPLTKSIMQKETCTTGDSSNGGSTSPVSNPTVITPSIPGMLNATYYYLNSNKDGCGKGVFVGNTGVHVQNGQFVYQSGEYKTEAECKNAYSLTKPTGIMCTMEARLCPDGSTMYRDASCGWHPESCSGQSSNSTRISSIFFENSGTVAVIGGGNLNKAESIEIRDPNNPSISSWGGIIDLSKVSIQPYMTRSDNEIRFTQHASEILGCKIIGDTKSLIPKVQIMLVINGVRSNSQTYTCPVNSENNKVTIESIGSNAGIGFYSVILSGNNFNQVNYIEEEHLVDGKQTISRSSFTSSSNNSIVFPLQVCQGCKYTSYINTVDKNGIKSNILPFLIDNTTPVPANALKAMSATLYNTKTSYVPGETIRFSIQGYDSNGQVATPAKGFNVQYHMYDVGVNGQVNGVTTMINGIYQADNAVFNYNTSMWDITATAPNENLSSGSMRKLEASFYCSSKGLGCYENQIEKSFMFSIVPKVIADTVITSFSFDPDTQKFNLSARNYSSISFKADCGQFVSLQTLYGLNYNLFPVGGDSICNREQFFQRQGVDTGVYNDIYDEPLALWKGDEVDGTITYVGNSLSQNLSGTFTITIKVCNLNNKCIEQTRPGKVWAKG